MKETLQCRCGQTELEVSRAPILSCECACTSCRTAAQAFAGLEPSADPTGPLGTTHFVVYRKDRVRCLAGAEHLMEYRLAPDAATRRVVAGCCHTPVFLEFSKGHWLSMYAGLWPEESRPDAEMRTMASDLPPGTSLPDDLPNSRTQSPRFMLKLLGAWIAMGFRTPEVSYVQGGTLDV